MFRSDCSVDEVLGCQVHTWTLSPRKTMPARFQTDPTDIGTSISACLEADMSFRREAELFLHLRWPGVRVRQVTLPTNHEARRRRR